MEHYNYNQKGFKIDLEKFKIQFKHEVKFLKEYFEFNTNQLRERKTALNLCLQIDIKDNPSAEIYLRDLYFLDFIKIPTYFYHASIVTLYSNLEKNLNTLCAMIQSETTFIFELNDLSGSNIIEKSRKYLIKVAGIDFTKIDKEWMSITDFQKLRNLIVHNNSKSKDDDNSAKLFKRIKDIESNPQENEFYITSINPVNKLLSVIEVFIDNIVNQIEESTYKRFKPAFNPANLDLFLGDENDDLPF